MTIDEESGMRILIPELLALAVGACTTVPEQIQGDYPDIVPNSPTVAMETVSNE